MSCCVKIQLNPSDMLTQDTEMVIRLILQNREKHKKTLEDLTQSPNADHLLRICSSVGGGLFCGYFGKKTDSQPENMQSQGGDKDPLGQGSFSIICRLTLGWLPLEPPDGKLLQTQPPRPSPRILMYTSGSKIIYVQQDSQVILCSRQVWPIVKEILRDIRCFSLER